MRFLFNSRYAPLTNRIAFLNAPVDRVVKAHEIWVKSLMEPIPYKISALSSNFESVLVKSLPYMYPWKDIFLQTSSNWTAYYQNQRPTDLAMNISRILDTELIFAEALPSSYGKKINGWGGGSFSYYKSDALIRHLMLSDQDRWEFDIYGAPLSFEDTEKYKEKFARNRFTIEMLNHYLQEFGIDFFNENFYMPEGSQAYIIEQVRQPWPDEEPMTLAEIRNHLMYE
jgi:hypothetical protein